MISLNKELVPFALAAKLLHVYKQTSGERCPLVSKVKHYLEQNPILMQLCIHTIIYFVYVLLLSKTFNNQFAWKASDFYEVVFRGVRVF